MKKNNCPLCDTKYERYCIKELKDLSAPGECKHKDGCTKLKEVMDEFSKDYPKEVEKLLATPV